MLYTGKYYTFFKMCLFLSIMDFVESYQIASPCGSRQGSAGMIFTGAVFVRPRACFH